MGIMGEYLNVGCGTHYFKGWVNSDVVDNDYASPDVLVAPGEPYPFEDDTFDAVYMGHVLEHIDWDDVFTFLQDINRIAKPGAPILAVGPDVYRTIQRWSAGQEPWSMIESVLENQDVYGGYLSLSGLTDSSHWRGASHHWNCHEARLLEAMKLVFADVRSVTNEIPCDTAGRAWYDPSTHITWPVVGYWYWQCAIMGRAQ